jgi:hypothetical protein
VAVAVLGDVVGSREVDDQAALLRRLAGGVAVTAEELPAVQPPRLTIGDEFQAVYASLAAALEASLRLRLRLGTSDDGLALDLRIGVGEGEVEVTGAAELPAGQSGTAWWRARDAIDAVSELVGRSQWPRSLRTVYRGDGEDDGRVMAYLLCQDELLARLDDRDRHVLLGLLDGRPQADVAADLGISQPAVAKRQHDHGLVTILRALEAMGRGA